MKPKRSQPAGPRAKTCAPTRLKSPPPPANRRILLVDDHPLTCEGMAVIINSRNGFEVCGTATDPAEAMSLLPKLRPDLMVTDLTMPGRGGIEFIKDVHALLPDLPILVLSMHDELLYAERALRAGARGYLMKDAGSTRVLEVIGLLLSGESYVSTKVSARLLDAVTGRRPRGSTSPIEKLSDREFEVFQLIGGGKSTKEIAQALHLSPKTIDVHRTHIKEKLGFTDAPSLVHHAVCWVESRAGQGAFPRSSADR